MAHEIRTEVQVVAGGCSGPGRSTVLHLSWSVTDPMCVHLTMTSRPTHPSLPRGTWVASRDLLTQGVDHQAGAGDVRVRPERSRNRVWFELHAHGRSTSVAVPRGLLVEFLARSEALSPSDGEEAHELVGAAVDTFLARLRG